jgi:flagellin FlaB
MPRTSNARPADRQRGITGLETAIILIAFVVVASVFAFTVLSTGIFSSERSKETVFAGLQEAKSSIEPRGSVIAYRGDNNDSDTVYKVSFIVSNATAGEPIDLTAPYTANSADTDPDIAASAEYKMTVSYTDSNQHLSDVPWTVNWVGYSNGDSLLEQGEKAEITVWILRRDFGVADIDDTDAVLGWTADANGAHGILTTGGTMLDINDQFTLELKPQNGSVLNVERTLPARLDYIMDLK